MSWYRFFNAWAQKLLKCLCLLSGVFIFYHPPLYAASAEDELGVLEDANATTELEGEELQTRTALDQLSEQIAKASLSEEVRVLFAQREAISEKLKWLTTKKAVNKSVVQLMQKKEQLDASELGFREDPKSEKKLLLKAEIALHKSEVEAFEALLERIQAEVNVAYQKWQLAEIQIEHTKSIVDIETITSQIQNSTVDDRLDTSVGTDPKSKRKKHHSSSRRKQFSEADKNRLETHLADEQTHLQTIEATLEEHQTKIAEAEAIVLEKQNREDELYQKFELLSTDYEKMQMTDSQRDPHIRWAGPSGFSASVGFLSWPTHYLSAQDGMKAMSGTIGIQYGNFCRYKGRNICRFGVDFLLGGDPSGSSFLLGAVAYIEAAYPISDRFSMGGGLHGGYLAALGGHREGSIPGQDLGLAALGNRSYGLFGGQLFVKFKTSATTDLSVILGGTGIMGSDQAGSLFLGVRFTIALPKLEIDEKKTSTKATQNESPTKNPDENSKKDTQSIKSTEE